MVTYSTKPLMVEAAGCIVGVRIISAIVTGGRISSIIKHIIINFYNIVISESGLYRI